MTSEDWVPPYQILVKTELNHETLGMSFEMEARRRLPRIAILCDFLEVVVEWADGSERRPELHLQVPVLVEVR